MSIVERISFFELFLGFDEDILIKVASISTIKRFANDTLLFFEKDEAKHLYIVLDGTIKVYKIDKLGNEIFLYFLERGDLLTEFTNFERPTCFANLRFVADSEVLMIDYEKYKELMRKDIDLMERMLEIFVKKTTRLQCALNRETVFDVTQKVAHFIANQLPLFNAQKKIETAKQLNIQPETLSRVLRKLIRDKIIIQSADQIAILDQSKLIEIYE